MNAWFSYLEELINDEEQDLIIQLVDGTVIDTSKHHDWFVKHRYDFITLYYVDDETGRENMYYILDNNIVFFKTVKGRGINGE